MTKTSRLLLVAAMATAFAAPAGAADEPTPAPVEIGGVTCKQMMAGNDDERRGTIAFFQGYTAGKKGAKTVDLAAAADLADKVRDHCLSNPGDKVLDAFAKAAK